MTEAGPIWPGRAPRTPVLAGIPQVAKRTIWTFGSRDSAPGASALPRYQEQTTHQRASAQMPVVNSHGGTSFNPPEGRKSAKLVKLWLARSPCENRERVRKCLMAWELSRE